MQMLWDRPELPYRAVVPWPQVLRNGQWDWIESVAAVELWLESYVGPHWVRWGWSMFALEQSYLCGVSFARDPDRVLFLLKYSQ